MKREAEGAVRKGVNGWRDKLMAMDKRRLPLQARFSLGSCRLDQKTGWTCCGSGVKRKDDEHVSHGTVAAPIPVGSTQLLHSHNGSSTLK